MIRIIVEAVLFIVAFGIGQEYGQKLEAELIAEGLKLESLTAAEYRTVLSSVKTREQALLARLKKYL